MLDEAGALGCGGAVVYGAGLRRGGAGRGATSGGCAEVALRHSLPVCGPNGNGIVAVGTGRGACGATRCAPLEPGPVALVSQSGNVAVNALAGRRGAALPHRRLVRQRRRWWTRPTGCASSPATTSVRSIALYLEGDGDGALLCEALAECAERGVGVAVLKVGESTAGAAAATAHTGALAGDQRVFRALVEEAGAAWAADVHELLELAKALAVRRAAPHRRSPGGTRGAHLLRRRLRAGGRRVRAARAAASPVRAGDRRAAARAAPRRRHGRATRSTTRR